MMKRFAMAASVLALSMTGASAATTTYVSQVEFLAAAPGVTLEDFNDFQQEVSFATADVVTSTGLTIRATGTPLATPGRNAVDVPPFGSSSFDVDGTALLNVVINSFDDTLTITLPAPVNAFGASFGAINDQFRRTNMEIGTTPVTMPFFQGTVLSFFGVGSDDAFDVVRLTYGGMTDGFSMDNVYFGAVDSQAVPLPAAGLVMVGGLAIFARRRR